MDFDERQHRSRRNRFFATVAKGLERDSAVRGGGLQWRTKGPHILEFLLYQHRHVKTRRLCPQFTRIAWNFQDPWIPSRRFWKEYESLDRSGKNHGTEITILPEEEDDFALWLPSWLLFRDEEGEKPEPFQGLEKLLVWPDGERVYRWSGKAGDVYENWKREEDSSCRCR